MMRSQFNEFEIRATAGMLRIVLDTSDGGVVNVKEIKSNSPLEDWRVDYYEWEIGSLLWTKKASL